MTKRQTHQNMRLDLRLQARGNRCQIKTAVVTWHQLVVAELAKNNRFLISQYARMQQVRQDALDAVRVLAHVFNEQNAAFNRWQVGRANQ